MCVSGVSSRTYIKLFAIVVSVASFSDVATVSDFFVFLGSDDL